MSKQVWAGVADDQKMIADAQRVRNRVFVMEKGLLNRSTAVIGREIDAYDHLETTVHFIAYIDGAPAATTRLLRPHPAVAQEIGQPIGIDLASRYDLSPFDLASVSLAEVSRLCVLPEHRRSEALTALYRAMYQESLRIGLTHWVAAANTETDALEDARIAHRLLQHKGLVSTRFQVAPRIWQSAEENSHRPFYTPDQRSRARAGNLTGLPVPRTLQTFARLAGRYMGSPIREEHYTVCSLPLVVDLADAAHMAAVLRHDRQARAA
jgi:L-ornithine Nalpha-acyltransferase